VEFLNFKLDLGMSACLKITHSQSHLEMIHCSRKSTDFLAHSHFEFPTLSKENIREGEMTTLKHSIKKSYHLTPSWSQGNVIIKSSSYPSYCHLESKPTPKKDSR